MSAIKPLSWVWRLAYPDHTLEYASRQAVEVVLKIKARLWIGAKS
jgi:hypothetical protein